MFAQASFGTLEQTGPIGFTDGEAETNLDAATFLPDDGDLLAEALAVWWRRPNGIASNVSPGRSVFKIGAATERTTGVVVATDCVVRVPYATDAGVQIATFVDQIGISPFTARGDSGALVLTSDGEAVGLHFASCSGMSVCTPIRTVLRGLGVSFP